MAPPESFMPARRFKTEAIKSPITEVTAIKRPQTAPCVGEKSKEPKFYHWHVIQNSQGMRAPIPAEAANPPIRPSIVLPGLMKEPFCSPNHFTYQQSTGITEFCDHYHP